MLIVTGGYVPPDGPNSPAGPSHDSTEMLVMSPGNEWTEASPLPRKIFSMASASLNNKVYLVGEEVVMRFQFPLVLLLFAGGGGFAGDSVLEFDGNDWKMVGKLSKRREFPGIARVHVKNLDFCQ